MSYTDDLLAAGIRLLVPFTTAKAHHLMECTTCGHQWSATPISKLQSHKRTGRNGCPSCATAKREADLGPKRQEFLASLPSHIQLLSEYDGRRVFTGKKVRFRNTQCGHEFECNPTYIVSGQSECVVCGNMKFELCRPQVTVASSG